MDNLKLFSKEEKAGFILRALYEQYGYSQYKMSKFEEYDLYANNKNFLVSDNVITFTDTDGKLMALKPDVTLSIIKNGKDLQGINKVYYNENVYRVSKGTKSFKEIMQTGLECFGDVDDYAITEVLYLAVKSLESISEEYVLDLSSLSLVESILKEQNLGESCYKEVIAYLAQKNVQGVLEVVRKYGVSEEGAQIIKSLVTCYGAPKTVFNQLKALPLGERSTQQLNALIGIINQLEKLNASQNVRIDFSVINDVNYYNGLVFKGYVSGVPTGVLAGGQYDNLMAKMNKKARAIGFAVYLDQLSRLNDQGQVKVIDTLIRYYDNTDMARVFSEVEKVTSNGKSALAVKVVSDKIKYKNIIDLKEGC